MKNKLLFKTLNVNLDEQIESIKSEYIEQLNKQATFKNELSYLTEQLNLQKVKLERLDDGNSKFLQERQNVSQKKLQLEIKLSVIQKDIEKQISTFRVGQVNLRK